jgi:dTMP kinase
MRGALIVLEGCDRTGKSTQAKLLRDALRAKGYRTVPMKFPNRDSSTGKLLELHLKGMELHPRAAQLLFSANRWEEKDNIEELLDSGAHVVCDRYVHSGAVYARAIGAPPCMADVGLPAPDMVLFLDMPIGKLAERAGYGDELYEKQRLQQKARLGFMQFRKRCDVWYTFDAERSVEEISSAILREVEMRLPYIGARRVLDMKSLVM